MENEVKSISEIKPSDTIIELKTNIDASEGCSADKDHGEGDSKSNPSSQIGNTIDKEKSKPPPLDVSAAQDFQGMDLAGAKTPASTPPVSGQFSDRRKLKERKIGHRRVDEEGQITFKKIQTSQIMGSIQLGISYSIGRLASKPERDLLMHDFTIVESTFFPKNGSSTTPAHTFNDFRFKAYAPVAFRYFRDLFGIQPDDYLLSLCNYPLRELSNPGASGSIFYLSSDDEFIIKTVDHREALFLQKLLPGYYMNLNQNPRTLLPKFFGLYCFQCSKKNVRLVVMNNLLPSVIKMHMKYDLKGSTYGRRASKSELKKASPTYKDLDFLSQNPQGIYLDADIYAPLIKTIQRDCRVLESFQIMDYSLLVGVHNLTLAKREKEKSIAEDRAIEDETGKVSDDSESVSPVQVSSCEKSESGGLSRSKSINRQRLFAFSTAMESIQAEADACETDVPPGGIPAKNDKGENLLLFIGIIDILQSFRLRKRLEHTLKSVLHDGDTVSVHRPSFYAQRFQDFMAKTVFRKSPAGQHRKFKTMVTSVLALKHSPSKRKGVAVRQGSTPASESEASKNFSKLPSESEGTLQEDETSTATAVPFPSTFSEIDSSTVVCDLKTSWSGRGRQKSRSNTDPPKMISLRSSSATGKTSVTWDKTEVVSLSQVTIQTEATADCVSETSSSSTSGFGSTLHTVTWTPPHSVEGSTPTHTEGTPSFTESSSSGDAACPTTPVKSINKSMDSLPPLGETQILHGTEMTRL